MAVPSCGSVLAFGLALAGSGCGAVVYACEGDDTCRHGEIVGVCQPEGVCSFPDDNCPSGQRYGEHGGGLAGQCVPADATTGGSSSSGDPGTTIASTVADSIDTLDGTITAASDSSGATSSSTDATTSTSSDDGDTDSLDPGLLLHFTFDDVLADGLDNTGVLGGIAACTGEGCPVALVGPVGMAARFDGVDDCGVFPHEAALAPEQFTLALWARRDRAVPGFDGAFTKPVGETAYNTWRMTVYGADKKTIGERLNVHVGLADDSGVDSFAPLPLVTWVHFAATWSGSAMVSFVDGVRHEELPSELIEVDDHPVLVGCDDDHIPGGLTHFLHGSLDDVRMYDRVLTDDEIAALHALGTP